MTGGSARWDEIDRILEGALAAPPEARSVYLDSACEGDAPLRAEVESLLTHAEPGARMLSTLPWAASPSQRGREGPSPGSEVGPYRVEERISTGSMTSVHRATDVRTGETVALKFTRPDQAGRVAEEVRAIEAIRHPNVVALLDWISQPQGLVLVMEHIAGETLRARLARGPLSWLEAVRLIADAARGLAAAHALGIVHRDVKPENLLIALDGGIKVLDFGIAKRPGVDLTASGVVLGTVSYMSREQVSGADVTSATDVWALGVILYEAIVGTHPFQAASPPRMLHRLLHETAPPLPGREAFPPGLAGLVAGAMHPAASSRPGAAEWADGLDALLPERGRGA